MSTEHQQYSPDNQADIIRQYAADHNMKMVQVSPAMGEAVSASLAEQAQPADGRHREQASHLHFITCLRC
jgi:hypothetical protein